MRIQLSKLPPRLHKGGRPRIKGLDKVEILRLHHEQLMSNGEIGKLFKVSRETIRRLLKLWRAE